MAELHQCHPDEGAGQGQCGLVGRAQPHHGPRRSGPQAAARRRGRPEGGRQGRQACRCGHGAVGCCRGGTGSRTARRGLAKRRRPKLRDRSQGPEGLRVVRLVLLVRLAGVDGGDQEPCHDRPLRGRPALLQRPWRQLRRLVAVVRPQRAADAGSPGRRVLPVRVRLRRRRQPVVPFVRRPGQAGLEDHGPDDARNDDPAEGLARQQRARVRRLPRLQRLLRLSHRRLHARDGRLGRVPLRRDHRLLGHRGLLDRKELLGTGLGRRRLLQDRVWRMRDRRNEHRH